MDAVDLVWGERDHVVVDGVAIHVEAAGPASAPTVVGLHGFASGTFTWAGVAPALTDRLRVVAWDRPPFGRSERPRPGAGADDPYALAAELDRATRVVEQVAPGADKRVLVGHSAGALLALQLVLARSLRVEASC